MRNAYSTSSVYVGAVGESNGLHLDDHVNGAKRWTGIASQTPTESYLESDDHNYVAARNKTLTNWTKDTKKKTLIACHWPTSW